MAAEDREEEGRRSPWVAVGAILIVLTIVGGLGLLCGGGLLAGAGGSMWLLYAQPAPVVVPPSPVPGVVPPARSPVALPARSPVAAPSGPGPDDIAGLEPDRWHTISTPLPTPLPAFDALQGLDWATGLARRWQADAELHVMFASDVKVDGTLDLVSDSEADADYRFFSPRLTELAKSAEQVTDETVWSGFRVWVSEGEVRVMITDSTFTAPSMKDGRIDPRWTAFQGVGTGCDQKALLRAVRADKKVDKRPRYDIHMRQRLGSGFVMSTTPGEGYYSPQTCQKTR